MNQEPIRVMVVDADPESGQRLAARLSGIEGLQVVEVAHNRNMTKARVQELDLDVLLVDLMFPGYRSIDIMRYVADNLPQIRVLALSPADPPHDRVMLAAQAGALGYVCRDADLSEFEQAIKSVQHGQPWLPLQQTYEVLQDGAGELAVSSAERRDRLMQIILGLVPLTGFVAAFTAYLWRQYWGDIDVRVVDLGVDPTTRMFDVLIFFLRVLALFGPLLFISPWMEALSERLAKEPRWVRLRDSVQGWKIGPLALGRFLFSRGIALVLLGVLLLFAMFLLNQILPLIVVLFIGPAVGVILLANLLELDDELPEALHLPHLESGKVLGFFVVVLIAFVLLLGTEVLFIGPDLRPDGLHGFLAPQILGFRAQPIMLYDLEEKNEPLGALYLGGNADLYVLYDPCAETVRLVPVGSSRVELIDTVPCPSP